MNLFGKNFLFVAALCISTSFHTFANVPLPGDGAKSLGMGGVAVATPQDTFVLAANPAGAAFICDGYDLGLTYIRPNDTVKIRNNPLIPHKNYNSSPEFYIPELGMKKDVSCFSLGFCAYGRGAGVNYGRSIPLYGTSKVKLNFKQLIAKPCLAWKIDDNQAIGVGVNLALSLFEQSGAENFKALSSAPSHVTNKGYDYRPGIGINIGWMGRYFNRLTLGIAYDSQIFTHRFKKYRGFIAQHGKADGPSIVTLGFSYDVTCRLVVAFDFQKIFWSPLRALSNRLNFVDLLGTTHGSGKGWTDEDRYKFGLSYRVNDSLVLRAGYIYIHPFFSKSQLFNNISTTIIFPNQYITAGCSWTLGCHEISLAYLQTLNRSIKGDLPVSVGGGRIDTKSMSRFLAISYSGNF